MILTVKTAASGMNLVLQFGAEKIVADTVHTNNAFPDIRLFADEVIWAGDEKA